MKLIMSSWTTSPHLSCSMKGYALYKIPEVQKVYQREWIAARRRDWLAEHGPCVDCGSWERLEIDHIEPAFKVTHRVWSWAPARRDEELAKCAVRCHDCHLRRTLAMRPPRSVQHGTRAEYQNGCHCQECRAANATYKRQRKHIQLNRSEASKVTV